MVIAHSEGGLLAREYLRQQGSTSFNALITVGTPNEGAPIIDAVLDGTASSVIVHMINKLLLGPYVAFYNFLPNPIGSQIVNTVDNLLYSGQQSLQAYLNNQYQNEPGINDMKPNSSFIATLNQNPENTLPSARYAVYGAETLHTPWHLVGSAFYSQPGEIEDLQGIKVHDKLESIYPTITASAAATAENYRYLKDRARYNYNFDDYWKYLQRMRKWQAVAAAFYVGFESLYIGDQKEWSAYVTHSLIPQSYSPLLIPQTWYAEDGILSSKTQAPSYFGALDNRRLRAFGANHLEETAHPSVKAKLEQIFQNSDVDITSGDGDGDGGGDIIPLPGPGNCNEDDPEKCPQKN